MNRRTTIEFASSGEGTFADCVLKINGEPVPNVLGLSITVEPGGWVVTTVEFRGGPVSFNGTLFDFPPTEAAAP